MKKTVLSAIAGLLGVITLATSCSFSPVEDSKIPMLDYQYTTEGSQNQTEAATKAPAVPSNPAELVGKWKSATVPMMFQFFSDNTLKCYYLTPGFYEYNEILTGTYSYDGLVLTYNLSDESSFEGDCSVASGKMTINGQFEFTSTNELPTEHPSYDFPDFEAIAAKNPLGDGKYTGNSLPEGFRAEVLSELQKSYWNGVSQASWKKLESGTAKLGDMVNIDYEGKLDGVAFAGGTDTNQVVEVNDGTGMIDGFCIGIAGKSVGQTFDVAVKFPENYHSADLAGKDAVFTMKLNAIYDFTLTDEEAKAKDYDSLEAWLDAEVKVAIENRIWDLIPDLKDVNIPKEASQFFDQYYLDYLHYNAFQYFSGSVETCLAYMGITMEEWMQQATDVTKTYLHAAQIVARYSLTPDAETTQKLEEEYINSYKNQGYTEEEAKNLLENEGKTEFRAQLLLQVAIDYMVANNFNEAA